MEDRVTRFGRGEQLALLALSAIGLITAGWWALALWPAGAAAPEWLARTRYVCFGASPGGLPDAGGWILLIGQPLSMLGFLMLVWGGAVRSGLRHVMARRSGRVVLVTLDLVVLAAIGGVALRLWAPRPSIEAVEGEAAPSAWPRLDREAPPLELVDQTGSRFRLADLRGRVVMVAFAYAHCETVCPLVVNDVVSAKSLVPELDAAVVVVTIDPWRDTPARLPSIARAWRLGEGDRALSGSVGDVERVLAQWGVPIRRDERTGLVDHPAIVFLLAPDGRIAFVATGGAERLAALARRS